MIQKNQIISQNNLKILLFKILKYNIIHLELFFIQLFIHKLLNKILSLALRNTVLLLR